MLGKDMHGGTRNMALIGPAVCEIGSGHTQTNPLLDHWFSLRVHFGPLVVSEPHVENQCDRRLAFLQSHAPKYLKTLKEKGPMTRVPKCQLFIFIFTFCSF